MHKPLLLILLLLTGSTFASERQYKPALLEAGNKLFLEHCAVCHGSEAQSTVENWQEPDASGKMPPPPLNGTAHTWHHPTSALVQTILKGTGSIGGNMPAFESRLSETEALTIIYWLTSLWSEDLYNSWRRLN